MAVVSATTNTEPKATSPVEPWRAALDEVIAIQESWGDQQESEYASIILKMLLAFPEKGYLATLEASLRIGADYWAKYLPSSVDPLNKPYRLADKGWRMYLYGFYETFLEQAWLLRYDDPRQDCLVHLLMDLQNLPKVTYRSYGKEWIAYHNDSVWGELVDDKWNAKFASDQAEPTEPEAKKDFILTCDEWVNYSCFLARFSGSEAHIAYEGQSKWPSIDVELALEKPIPAGKLGQCRLLVASNWLIHAGKFIYEDMKKTGAERWGLGRWGRWTEAIRGILKAGEQTDEVTARLQAALDTIVSLTPDAIEVKESTGAEESSEGAEMKESSEVKKSSEVKESGEVKNSSEEKEAGEAK
ncbi:hypothetical protein JMJ77_0010277 [Colletotrichum scovillei]|uniref:Uncharacterized protein n=1 Tax=Colletotrichum scovillei TaxID=1209932 RepID=A0A9P7U965_9PEZI|nr:hypothetical protein JMJ78_0011655 [Colletotrichum scovillei]KAG7042174.1 hypothetical protein JMJ77_0010277 [Colletotrichum scovillei]KAG7062207.1 hypothetical protein JMJ76_0006485 [Colletotrichum scovillei]